jgi:ankyrin repeat protein
VSVCAGLVVVDQESAVIRLVHYTTQEYFERTGDAWVPDAQLHIARTCLTYLCFDAFQSGSCSADEEYEKRLQEHQFLDYAAKHWGEHARKVEDDIAGKVWKFLNSTSLSCAAQVMRVPIYKYEGYSKQDITTTPLHELAHFGLAIVAEKIVSAPELIEVMANAKDNRGDPPLSLAATQGHCEMVKKLLDNKANVNAQGGCYSNALYAASREGHEQVVKTLLDRGADVNVQGRHYSNALQAASARGHKQVVKMLLDKGAEVNVQGAGYSNALQAASARGHKQVVKMLLDKGAEVNVQGAGYSNALQAASREGHEQVVKMLLDRGADVNAQGRYYSNALYAASEKGHEQVVKTLLDRGAEVNAQGGGYGNALQAASREGHEQVVKTLLDKGADVNAQGRYCGNAIHTAAYGGHTEILDLLITNCSISQLQDYYGRTLLWWAAAGGKTATIEALIHKHNMDPQTADNLGRRPFWIASKKGHSAASKLLQVYVREPNTSPTAPPNGNHTQSGLECDVCTSHISENDACYHCNLCAAGNWDVCEDCRRCGATCLETAHVLVKRAKLNGVWSETTS